MVSRAAGSVKVLWAEDMERGFVDVRGKLVFAGTGKAMNRRSARAAHEPERGTVTQWGTRWRSESSVDKQPNKVKSAEG